MKHKLKHITNLTVHELLSRDVILPSIYFEKFNHNARTLEVNLEDENFQKEINNILLDDYKNIENYMKTIIENIDTLGSSAKEASNALINKDVEHLHLIYKRMMHLEKNLQVLNDKLFIDDITNSYNRKWFYNKYLNQNMKFNFNGLLIFIDIIDFSYLQEKYGDLIANNLLIFVISFMQKNLKDEISNFKIVRFLENKFLILIEQEKKDEIENLILNLKQMLLNTTLKSNSGLYIKATYDFKIQEYKQNDLFEDIYQKLFKEED